MRNWMNKKGYRMKGRKTGENRERKHKAEINIAIDQKKENGRKKKTR